MTAASSSTKSTSRRGKRSGKAPAIAVDQPSLSIETIQEARDFAAHWQKILRLSDWQIQVDWGRAHEMEAVGNIQMNFNHRFAKVRLAPADTLGEEDRDVHASLVHELVHIFLHPIATYEGEAQKHAIEVACNRISEALVALAREAVDAAD